MASIERIGKYLLLRSNSLVNGEAKLPTTTQLEEGELALNFHDGVEKISIKNDNNEIVTFSSDDQVKAWISAGGGGTGGTVNGITGITMNGNAVSVSNYVANLGTVLTSFTETQLSTGTTSGNGNVVTNISVNNHQITLTKGLTIPSWATATTKPTYTASEVGALPTGTTLDNVADGTTRKLSDYVTTNTEQNITAKKTFTTAIAMNKSEAWSGNYGGGDVGHGLRFTIPNMAANNRFVFIDGGKALSSNNSIHFDFGFVGDSSTNNYLNIGFYSNNDRLKLYANGLLENQGKIKATGDLETGGNIVKGSYTFTLPSKTGTFALLDDIPTIPSWATGSTKPTYTASEVGALPTGTTLDEIADGTTRKLSNYSLTSHTHSNYATQANFTAHTGNTNIHVTTAQTAAWDAKVSNVQADWNATSGLAQILNKPTIPTVPTSNTAFTNDAGYITGYTETDPTVPSWAKAASKPTYTASEVGALPTGTTLDNVADGTTRKLSNYATQANFTAHTGNTNIHVTTAQTATWNEKQDAISDLTTIRNNASSGATAYTNVTAHTNNSNIHVTAAQKTNWNTAYNNRITGVTFTSGTTNSATISSNKLNITGATVPTYSASDSGKILSVNSSGQLVWITPVTIYTGSGTPDNSQGNNGDIYLQTS